MSEGESSAVPRFQNQSAVLDSPLSIDITPPAVTKSQYLMNNIPRGTSEMKLINYLLAPPRFGETAMQADTHQPYVQFACTITDSRLNENLSVATIEFTRTPKWLHLLNLNPTGFPKKTVLGTLWRGVDTIARDSDGRTKFVRAALGNNLLYAVALAEFPTTDINIQDVYGRTALHWAAAKGLRKIVILCLSVPGCDASLRDRENLTAFDLGLRRRDDVISNLFYNSNFTLDPREGLIRGLTVSSAPVEDKPVFPGAAMLAPAQAQNFALVEALVDCGVDLTATNSEGETALHVVAAEVGDAVVVRRLLEAGADIDATATGDPTAFNHAADEETVQVLQQLKVELTTSGTDVKAAHPSPAETKGKALEPAEQFLAGADANSAPFSTGKEQHKPTQSVMPVPEEIENRDHDERTPLHLRAQGGDLDAVLGLIKRGANVNALDNDERTPLYLAAEMGHTQIVTTLLANGADIERVNRRGWTALRVAAEMGHTEVVTTLLANGADIERGDYGCCTALHAAAYKGHIGIVTVLLENRANIEAKEEDGETALHLAALSGHIETISALLANGANVEAAQCDGWTALQLAARSGHSDAVAALLANGANIEAVSGYGETALKLAAQNGHIGIVTALLANGANIQAAEENGETALHLAARNGHIETIAALLANGAHIEATRSDGWTALHLAAENGHFETIAALVANGASIQTAAGNGETALHLAARNGHIETITALLANGAKIEAAQCDGWTTLHIAARGGHTEIVTTLLANRANLAAATKNGWRALHFAASGGHSATVTALLAHGAKVEAKSNDKRTALHVAILPTHLETVVILLDHGASATARSSFGTPLQLALRDRDPEVARILLASEAKPSRMRRSLHPLRHDG